MFKKKLLNITLISFVLGYNFEHYKYKISFKSRY